MPEIVTSEEVPLTTPSPSSTESTPQPRFASGANSDQNRGNRSQNRHAGFQSTNRDFAGATPKIGGVLGLRSENVTKKVNYDSFCEKLGIYVMNELKDGDAIVEITRNHKADIISDFERNNKPTPIDSGASDVDKEIHKEEIKEYVKDRKLIRSNLKKIYSLMYGNCTESLQTMLRADSEFEEKSRVFDHEWLFEKVKIIVSGLDTKVNLRVSLHDVMFNFILLKQQQHEANDAYLTRFKSMIETLKIAGGEHVLVSPVLLGQAIEYASKAELNEEKEKFMAVCFMLRSDESRYKTLLEGLKRSANLGRDEYPATLTEAFDLLVRESGEYDTVRPPQQNNRFRGRGGRGGRGRTSYLFAQQGRGGRGNSESECSYSRTNSTNSNEVVAGTDGEPHQNVTCFGCQFQGHYRNMCPYVTRAGVVSMHVGYTFSQGELFNIPKSWLLLDTCSTCNVSNSPDLVSNIRNCMHGEMLTAYTNGGSQCYDQLADLRALPLQVHFKQDSLATILSMKLVTEIPGARVTMDTGLNNNIHVILKDGKVFEFVQHHNGLYFFDTNNPVPISKPKSELSNYSLLTTVSENKEFFSSQEIKGADLSRKFQEYLFFPGPNTFKHYVNDNLITNCEITADDINRGEIIYGPLEPYVAGHMVRHKPPVHNKVEKIPLPLMIAKHHSNLSMAMDFFFINGNIFFHTKTDKINFLSAQYCTSRSLRTIMTALERIINKYKSRSFTICDYHADNEFDKQALKDFLQPALVHIYGRNEHVGPIERSVRTVKDRFRSTCANIPYVRITILMVRSLVEAIIEVLNAFPSKNAISTTISPATIVEGKPKMDFKRDMIAFGAYALVYTDTSNNNTPRTVPAIALRMSNNAGGHYFMSLHSGKRIHGYKWKELPIDEHVTASRAIS